jgi:hypothetical protein
MQTKYVTIITLWHKRCMIRGILKLKKLVSDIFAALSPTNMDPLAHMPPTFSFMYVKTKVS